MKFNVVLASFFVWAFLGMIGAQSAAAKEVVQAANQFCPLSGDKVNPKMSYTFNGKRYLFCCKKCVKDFKKDPAKYISQMDRKEAAPEHAGHEHG
jgi:YHS domain-containing protein